MAPRIGITRWEDVPGERIEDYRERIEEASGEPVDLHRSGPTEGLDGLVLTGGYDVDPARYGEERHPKVKFVDPERDAFELALLGPALDRDLPVLAICRGSQLLNVAFGGRLLQHIDGSGHNADYRSEGYPSSWHRVRLEPGGRLREVYGADEIETNSRHHQAVLAETLAPGLRVAGRAEDGVIEAVESEGHQWVTGVQWHPERPERERAGFAAQSRELFGALVAECAKAGARS